MVAVRLDDILVCVTADLDSVPGPAPIDGYDLRPLDEARAADIDLWVRLVNDAFDRSWTADNYRLAMVENPDLVVLQTWFLTGPDGPVGTGSCARYRRNPAVGAGHYFTVTRAAQGRGFGHVLLLHTYAELRRRGFEVAETQTHLGRRRSLHAHFACGFRPKTGTDAWNTPASGPPEVRDRAVRALVRIYDDWTTTRRKEISGRRRIRR